MNEEKYLPENEMIENQETKSNGVSTEESETIQTAEFEVQDENAKPEVCSCKTEEKSESKCVSIEKVAICVAAFCALAAVIMSIMLIQSRKHVEYHMILTIDPAQKEALVDALTDEEKEEIIKQGTEKIDGVQEREQSENGFESEQLPIDSDNNQTTDYERPYIGIACMQIPDEYIESGYPQGVFIISVDEGSGAEFAGLQPYDIITAVEETPISSPDELVAAVRNYQPGDMITLKAIRIRNGRAVNKDIKVILGTAPRN